jgi:hypothetical protein
MAIILPGGFNITNNEPVDARITLADQTARYALSSANVYEGLIVFQQDSNTIWVLTDTSNVGNSNGWTQLQIGSVSSNLPDGVVSGSSQLTSSYDNRYVTLEGDQTIGSTKTFNNIVVNGTGSFTYIQSTTGSSTSIGEAFIILNENTPSSNFAGIKVVDSGSTFTTASFIYDGLNNNWVFEHEGSVDSGSSLAIFGPLSQGGLGTEVGLTENRIPKSVTNHGHHIGDSNISDSGTLITLNSNSQVNGNLVVDGSVSANNLISGSSQVIDILSSLNSFTSSIDTTIKTKLNVEGVISGSSQVNADSITNFDENVKVKLDIEAVISGSSQVNADSITNFDSNVKDKLNVDGVISGSSQVNADSITNFDSNVKDKLNTDGVVSGSSQINADSITNFDSNVKDKLNTDGVVSGSSQIDLTSTTNYVSGIKTRLNAETVVSGSSQVIGILSSLNSFTSSINTTIKSALNTNTVVSGSSQISLGSASGNIALATQTTGNYVASLVEGIGVTITNNSGENATPTIAIGQVVGTTSNVQFGSIGVGTTASGVSGEIRATGDIVAFYSSDIRLKENIIPIPNALEKVKQISGNTYDWKEGYDGVHSHKGNDVGVIAQEIEQILPQIVTNRDTGFKAVQYEKIIPLLIEAIKELSTKIDRLENK